MQTLKITRDLHNYIGDDSALITSRPKNISDCNKWVLPLSFSLNKDVQETRRLSGLILLFTSMTK